MVTAAVVTMTGENDQISALDQTKLDRADVALVDAKDALAELIAHADAARMPPPPGEGLKQEGGYIDAGLVLWSVAQGCRHAVEAIETARLAVDALRKHQAAGASGNVDTVLAAHDELMAALGRIAGWRRDDAASAGADGEKQR